MPDRFNKLKNADFTAGVTRPTSWQWSGDAESARWSFSDSDDNARNVVLTNAQPGADAYFCQRVRCKAEHWYRIEAVITGRCDGGGALSMYITPRRADGSDSDPIQLAEASCTLGPTTLRGFHETAPGVKSFALCVGFFGATGEITLHSALVIPNIEPEVTANPVAVPPPPYAVPSVRKVRRVCVCDDTGEDRPLVSLLRTRFGRGGVEHLRRSATRLKGLKSDALIIAGDKPPAGIRSLKALESLASRHVVIVSLNAFAKIADCGLTVRTIEQPDDPIWAKTVFANFITSGFALHDIASWAATTNDARIFRQRHLRKGAALNKLLKSGYDAILVSETDAEPTSGHPICLYKPIDGGGVIVFDCDPIETLPTTCDEPNVPAFVLLNMLGADQVASGRFMEPAQSERKWLQTVKELALRLPGLSVSGKDRHDMLLEVGGGDAFHGLPVAERPMILIRTGLRGDDFAGMYGCLQYIKNLVRQPPYDNPYVGRLLRSFRLAWIPLCAPFQPTGWDASLAATAADVDGDFEPDSIAAVIDITTAPVNQLRIAYANAGSVFARHAELLPSLASAFSTGRYTYRAVAEGQSMTRRDTLAWRKERLIPKVCIDAPLFDTSLHASAHAAGANLIRIEVPGTIGDFTCNSIWRTDLVATTLEHVIGLHCGLLATNRGSSRVAFGDDPPLEPGGVIDIPAPGKTARSKRAG